MKVVKTLLTGCLLAQAFGPQAFAQLKNQDAYEKWKAQNQHLVISDSGDATATATTSTTTTTLPVVIQPPVINDSLVSMSGPPRRLKTAEQNQELFSQYCIGDASSAQVPNVNYSNQKVMRAARILSKVANINFYYYADIKRIYKNGAQSAPAGITDNAHLFLVQTCGEFRDRAEMIEGKVNWVNNMIMLGSEPQKQNVDISGNIWTQLSGHSYNKYLQLSNQIFTWKAQRAYQNKSLTQTLHQDAQEPVDGFSVCETKYIISELIGKGQSVSDLNTYLNNYSQFADRCSQADLDYYYDFRGDSNFKQYSPEANGMIWHALSIARFCETPTRARPNNGKITDRVCEEYFKRPFLTRYNAAKSGLAAWLLHGKDVQATFANPGAKVTISSDYDLGIVGQKPFLMNVGGSSVSINKSILGFNQSFEEAFGLGSANADLSGVFERLRNAVNRHTNWYASAFNDQLGHDKSQKDQAYSPFVASSYEMSQSNGFTECGVTVACTGDGRKAWMLVFKIHKNNWYHTRSLMNNQRIDFDRMWFDETSFGTDKLADAERAWDRLGTALETELDSIIYLHNLGAGSGVPVANDTLE